MPYIQNTSIIVTGAGNGFGRLIALKAATRGARVVCSDIDPDKTAATVKSITEAGGTAIPACTDVRDLAQMKALAEKALTTYDRIDALVNNAGIMPLAFYADHQSAHDKWVQCIDVNFKGVLNGIVSVYDQMVRQGHGHIINVSSIYGNFPVAGAAVYGATKSAVNFLSEALRVEARGKIKVTIIKPTGVPTTGLAGSVINPQAAVGIVGQNAQSYIKAMRSLMEGTLEPALQDPQSSECSVLDPGFVADQVIYALNQPHGVSVADITIRATGDHFIL